MNVLIDDCSPQIGYYSNSDGWITDHGVNATYYDASTSEYSRSTFHATFTEGDYMHFNFNGSGIALYGAKRPNHGIFGVVIDDGDPVYVDGWAESSHNVFQDQLFVISNLSTSIEHTITMTNYPLLSNSTLHDNTDGTWWMDVDHLIITQPINGTFYTTIIDDSSSIIDYDSDWRTYGEGESVFFNATDHVSSVTNSSFTLSYATMVMETAECELMIPRFNGSSIQVISGVNSDHGNYSISLDGRAEEMYNSTFFEMVYQVPLYTVTGLSDTEHTLTFTNRGSGDQYLVGFDYAIVNSTVDHSQDAESGTTQSTTTLSGNHVPIAAIAMSTTSDAASTSTSSSHTAAIAGSVAGGVVGLALVALLAWYLFRDRKVKPDQPPRPESFYYAKPVEQEQRGEPPFQLDLIGDEESEYKSRSNWSSTGSPATLIRPLSAPLSAALTEGMGHSSQGSVSRPFLSVVPPPPMSNATSYIASAGPFRGPNTAGNIRAFNPPPTTAPSVYSQEGTYISAAPAHLEPHNVHGSEGTARQDRLLGDCTVSWGSKGAESISKLDRDSQHMRGPPSGSPVPNEERSRGNTPTSPHIISQTPPLLSARSQSSLQVTASSPLSPESETLSSTEAAYKSELVRLPYTATPPRWQRSDRDDSWARIQKPGREIDMGPAGSGTLPLEYAQILQERLANEWRSQAGSE